MNARRFLVVALALALVLFVCVGCAPGTERYETSQAGFWAGLWHGLIMIITFVIGLFAENVRMYEPNNVGALYDLGFLFGAIISLGCCASSRCKSKRSKVVHAEPEWDEIERKVKAGIRKWADESEEGEWEEVARKVEEKIKRELRDWADN